MCFVFTILFLGKGEGDVHEWVKRVKNNHRACKRWRNCCCLVIDEISMMSADMFENLDTIARTIRKKPQLFGGIAIVVTGDFQQLRPVKASRLCFQSVLWDQCFPNGHCIELTKIYRQQDTIFTDMLNNVRDGHISADQVQLLTALQRPFCTHYNILPTMLKSLNTDVTKCNLENLQRLKNPIVRFVAEDTGTEPYLSTLQKSCNVDETVELAIGAQVILLRNLDFGFKLPNGSRGVITAFNIGGFPMVSFFFVF